MKNQALRRLEIVEVITIVRRVLGMEVYHIDMTFHSDCEEYIWRRR